jgi:beta-glucanase (GH16 family)
MVRHRFLQAVKILALLWLIIASTAQFPTGEWKLVWLDEFDRPGLPDPTRWTYEQGFVRNNELQLYTRNRSENARVAGGVLIIEARKEPYKNPDYDPARPGQAWRFHKESADYTSASLVTRGIAEWKYGLVEVRARLPRGKGLWPAIWMLGTNQAKVGWPACGEIDIMENVGFEPDTIHGTIHTAKYNHIKKTQKGDKITIPAPWEDFHIYAMEWDENRLDMFVDGRKYFSFSNERSGPEAWPFDQPMYLILNVAFGGSWGGQQGIDDSVLPQSMTIDYVRVYQRR